MTYFGLPEYGPAVSCVADPRFVLPELLYLRKGSKLEIFKDNCLRRPGGVCDPTIGQIVGSPPGQLRVYDFLDDRWTIAAKSTTVAGDYTFRVTQGAAFSEVTIRVVNALDPGAPALRSCFVGDSGVGVSGADRFPGIVQAALPSLVAVGTKGAGDYLNEGLNTSWATLVGGGAGSSFSSGATFDLTTFEAWVTAVGGDCDVMHLSMVANDLNSFADDDPSTWVALIASTLADADEFLSVALAAMPACVFLVGTGWPGNMANAPWQSSYSFDRDDWRELYHLYLEAALPHFQGREAENIYLSPTHLEINPQGVSNYGDYPSGEAHHYQTVSGHPRTARRIANDFVGHLGLST